MKLIHALLLSLVLLFPVVAHADVCRDIAMSAPSDIAKQYKPDELQKLMATCKKEDGGAAVLPSLPTTPEEASKWGDTAKAFAQAIGIAARELGMATNEFLKTDAGKLTAGLIAWKVAGDDAVRLANHLIEMVVAIPLALLLIVLFWKWLQKHYNTSVKYDYKPMLWGLWQKRVVIERSERGIIDDGGLILGCFLWGGPILALLLIGIL